MALAALAAEDFNRTWVAAHTQWQSRWAAAFDPEDPFFTGVVPTLELDTSDPASAGVARVYYQSALSVVSQMRTNLPLMHDKVRDEGLTEAGGQE